MADQRRFSKRHWMGLILGGMILFGLVHCARRISQYGQVAPILLAASDLKQLAVGIQVYSNEHDGRAPTTLEELRPEGYISSDLLDRILATVPRKGPVGEVEYLLDGGEILTSLATESPPRLILRRRFDKKRVIEVRADLDLSVIKQRSP